MYSESSLFHYHYIHQTISSTINFVHELIEKLCHLDNLLKFFEPNTSRNSCSYLAPPLTHLHNPTLCEHKPRCSETSLIRHAMGLEEIACWMALTVSQKLVGLVRMSDYRGVTVLNLRHCCSCRNSSTF